MKTPRELAEALNVSEFSIYRLIQAGRIHAVKVGRQWRIPEKEARRVAREGTDRQAHAKEVSQ
ncbi:MAG: helix-turn-helix domain-containing protein [Pigmentiphaga sp.]|nr:helix-turn-helix domain-containing protein [Pigmentiphaga sp.]